MRFIIKALLQNIFSRVPQGETLNFFFTRMKGVRPSVFWVKVAAALRHFAAYRKYAQSVGGNEHFYEFGAGRNLIIPLTLFGLGANCQVITDIKKLIRGKLINETLKRFKMEEKDLANILSRNPGRVLPALAAGKEVMALKEHFGIEYLAPCDARSTALESETVDLIYTTDTLEHISLKDNLAIIEECWRVLKPGGIMSHIIDMQDHYCYFDRTISPYNFLKYSESSWRLLNPDLHYQSRLRHQDYIEMVSKSKFKIMEDNIQEVTTQDIDSLRTVKLNEAFLNYPLNELAIKRTHLVLQKEGSLR